MKKSMLILILTALLSGCGATENTQETAKIPTAQTTQITSFSTNAVTTEITEITTVSAEIATPECQLEITIQTTTVTDRQKEKNQENPPNHEQNMDTTTANDNTENTTESSKSSTENTTKKFAESTQTEASKSTENTPIPTTEPEEYQEEIQTSSESSTELSKNSLSDYEKALEVYNFMTANGSGTCLQYSYQTYEMCRKYGLECYFAWTENHLYGHVANVVKIDDIWYVLDTQAGCFLTENKCGFTEIVDENENHIADADIISKTRY